MRSAILIACSVFVLWTQNSRKFNRSILAVPCDLRGFSKLTISDSFLKVYTRFRRNSGLLFTMPPRQSRILFHAGYTDHSQILAHRAPSQKSRPCVNNRPSSCPLNLGIEAVLSDELEHFTLIVSLIHAAPTSLYPFSEDFTVRVFPPTRLVAPKTQTVNPAARIT